MKTKGNLKNTGTGTIWRSIRMMVVAATTVLVSQSGFAAITNITATSDSTNIDYGYSYAGTPAYLQIYLDTDRNASTGYPFGTIGADHFIENGSVYRYSGSNGSWGWTSIGTSNMTRPTSSSVRWRISRSFVGSSVGINLIMATTLREQSAVINQTLSAPTTTQWTPCATEGGTCTFSGTRQVRYGVNGVYAYQTATGSIACNNATFGDPVVGAVKYCDYAGTLTTTTTVPAGPVPTTTTTMAPPPTGSLSQVSYVASTANFPNPERGFFNQLNCNSSISLSTLQNYKASGNTLIRCYFNIGAYVNTNIAQSTLDLFQNLMNNMRTAGVKTVMRFNYNNSDTGIDAALPQLKIHLDQLAPYLERNKDVIAVVEAGLIGSWGEGDNSINYGKSWQLTAQNWADRKTVANLQLAAVPVERMVSFHMPREKMTFDGSAPLTTAEAHKGTSKARHGHHNDCFLSTPTDWGTYTNTTTEYPYLAADSAFTAMGGETCKVNQPRSDCATALKELSMFHWSYLNIGYNTSVLDTWRAQGCFPEVQKRLGYRFVLQNGAYSPTAKPGGAMTVKFTVQNQGFAAPYNPRAVELVLRHNSTGAVYRMPLATDPRFWQPGSPVTVSQTVTLPAGMASGNYSTFLHLPDPMSSIRNRPEYAIQLANTGVWEASTGMNNLNHLVTVSP